MRGPTYINIKVKCAQVIVNFIYCDAWIGIFLVYYVDSLYIIYI